MLISLSVLIAICSLASGTLRYVPPSQSQCRQCSARELQAGRSVRGGRTFFGNCCNTGPTCTCGKEGTATRSSRNDDIDNPNRIIGGEETGVNQYPWMAGVIRSDIQSAPNDFLCGGALVAAEFVVTAALCVHSSRGPLPPSEITVVLGEHDTASDTETDIRKEVSVSKIIMSPIYASSRFTPIGDIAVLKLDEAVDLEVYTPICLPELTATWMDGQEALVTGWGLRDLSVTQETVTQAQKLQRVAVNIQTQATCDVTFTAAGGSPDRIRQGMVCAGEASKEACFGDEGGPLSRVDGTQHVLVGTLSTSPCSVNPSIPAPGLPSIFTDTVTYRRWLDETFSAEGGATFCS